MPVHPLVIAPAGVSKSARWKAPTRTLGISSSRSQASVDET
jgi:hypothetical protein